MLRSTTTIIVEATKIELADWEKLEKTVSAVIVSLPDDSVNSIYLLGTQKRWDASEWRAAMPLPPEAQNSCSFIASVMSALAARNEFPRAIILVGAGEVFDLEDWVNLGNQARWATVRVGDDPSLAQFGITEFLPDQLALLAEFIQSPQSPRSSHSPAPSRFVKHQWQLDRTGYPMVYVDPLNAYWHLFPITKPQFENFLAGAPSPERSNAWYADLLKRSPRLSPVAASYMDYERLFVGGVLPDDVQSYIKWHGQGVRLPTVEQWRAAFKWLGAQDVSAMPADMERQLAPTAYCMWNKLLEELQPTTLLDLSLMQNGMLEWVEGQNKAPLGMGAPRQKFRAGFHDVGKPFEPTAFALTHRNYFSGFRLLKSA